MFNQERLEKYEDGLKIGVLGNGWVEIGDWKFFRRGGSCMWGGGF